MTPLGPVDVLTLASCAFETLLDRRLAYIIIVVDGILYGLVLTVTGCPDILSRHDDPVDLPPLLSV